MCVPQFKEEVVYIPKGEYNLKHNIEINSSYIDLDKRIKNILGDLKTIINLKLNVDIDTNKIQSKYFKIEKKY